MQEGLIQGEMHVVNKGERNWKGPYCRTYLNLDQICWNLLFVKLIWICNYFISFSLWRKCYWFKICPVSEVSHWVVCDILYIWSIEIWYVFPSITTGAIGGEEGGNEDAEEEARLIEEARREQEEERKAKHAKMEEEREKERQRIRDKVGLADVHRFGFTCAISSCLVVPKLYGLWGSGY